MNNEFTRFLTEDEKEELRYTNTWASCIVSKRYCKFADLCNTMGCYEIEKAARNS